MKHFAQFGPSANRMSATYFFCDLRGGHHEPAPHDRKAPPTTHRDTAQGQLFLRSADATLASMKRFRNEVLDKV